MTRAPRTSRTCVLALVGGAIAISAAPARAKHTDKVGLGEIIKVSRLINSARLDEARKLAADLVKRAPDQLEVRWLEAEIHFQDGAYPDAIRDLAGIPDDAIDGSVGATRALAANSLAVTNGFVSMESPGGHFVIYYQPGPDELIADLAGETLDAAWQVVGDDLGWKPTDKVRVELLTHPEDLARLSPLTESQIETTGTIALSKYGKLMVVSPRATVLGYPWMDTLAHEYTHLVVSHQSHDNAPVWLQEGIARYEQTRWRGATPTLPPLDQRLLSTAIKARRLITLDEMHPSLAMLPSQEAAALAYAEVFTLVDWLQAKVGWSGVEAIVVKQRDGKSAARAVAEVVGKPWNTVEQSWRTSLRTLAASGAFDGGKGARARRIRFAKGGKDAENVGLDGVGNARAKKFARLGGMLRARGLLDAAAIEYEKALAAAPGDTFVAGKLARTYVELGKQDRAIELAKPLAAIDDLDPTPAVTLGVAYAASGDWAPAKDALEQALRITPFDPAVRCGLADAYDHLADLRAARERRACERLRGPAGP